jgi:hypothetical protein
MSPRLTDDERARKKAAAAREREASPVTKAIAGEHLPMIQRMATALDKTRGDVMRMLLEQWFTEHGDEARAAVEQLEARKRALSAHDHD